MNSGGSRESASTGALGPIVRALLVAGSVGAIALMLYAGRRQQSRILILLFAIWVLSPFIAAIAASAASKRWSARTETTLHIVAVVFTLGSLAVYANTAFGRAGWKMGTIFLLVPLASWLLLGAIPIAALFPGRRKR